MLERDENPSSVTRLHRPAKIVDIRAFVNTSTTNNNADTGETEVGIVKLIMPPERLRMWAGPSRTEFTADARGIYALEWKYDFEMDCCVFVFTKDLIHSKAICIWKRLTLVMENEESCSPEDLLINHNTA